MKRLIPAALILILLSSCHTTYYYARLDTNDPYMEKDKTGNFVSESDSIQIKYKFSGENAPVKVYIMNRMKKNLYIDWRNSWFVFGNDEESRINLGQYMEEWEQFTVIQPGLKKEKSLFELSNLPFDRIGDEKFEMKTIESSGGKNIKLKTIKFDEYTTPLYMRSYLTVLPGGLHTSPVIFEHEFYISDLYKARNLTPEKIPAFSKKNGDVFYTKTEHNKGLRQALSVGGHVLILTGVIAVDILLSTE